MKVSRSFVNKVIPFLVAMTIVLLEISTTIDGGEANDQKSILDNSSINNLVASPTRDINHSWVGLKVSWVGGLSVESIIYDIILEERDSLKSEEFVSIYNESVTGLNSTWILVPDLLAFWDYRVSARSRSDNATSIWFGPIQAKTLTNAPGIVHNLKVKQDAIVAKEIQMSFDCPQEKERNGTIVKYLVHKTLQESSTSLIKAVNQDYFGVWSDELNVYIAPRVPRLSEAGPASVVPATPPVGFTPGGSTVDLVICSKCLTESSQGTVTALGLVICVVFNTNNTCRDDLNLTTSNFSSFTTWASSARSRFTIKYRATPDDWHTTLLNSSETITFTLGSDSSCTISQVSEYCNGPLPPDMDITVSVIKCNAAGCDYVTFDGVFTTKARNLPKFNVIGFWVGVSMGSAVILCFIILGVVSCLTERRPTKSNDIEDGVRNPGTEESSSLAGTDLSVLASSHREPTVSGGSITTRTSGVGPYADDTPGCSSSLDSAHRPVSFRKSLSNDPDLEIISQEEVELSDQGSTILTTRSRQSSRRISITTLM